jgi:5-methyltetrahydropteroyltriglutamate--homocysteine methyltransferase
MTMATMYRADHVGSFLRPQEVLDAHDKFRAGQMSESDVREIENKAILQVLDLQKGAGIEIFTDGEYRRSGWAGEFPASVDGYVTGEVPIRLDWKLPDGSDRIDMEAIRQAVPQASGAVVGARLKPKRSMTATEVAFMKEHSPGAFKITMPAPSYNVARGWKPGISDKVYGSRRELLDDVANIIKGEVQSLVQQGVTYIQLDNPHYPDYIPEDRREQWRSIGVDPDQALTEDLIGDNSVLEDIDRNKFIVASHICRGNGRSAWHTQGGYERIAEQVFGSLNVDRWLLEYDSDRAGGFEPLRFIPQGKVVVLGLITTKLGQLENQDDIIRRIDEASKYVPMENLTLSPQCGFASVDKGNFLTWDEQRRKLELVVDTARKVWG